MTVETIMEQVAFFQVKTVKVSAATEGVVALVPDHFSPNGIQDTKKKKNNY